MSLQAIRTCVAQFLYAKFGFGGNEIKQTSVIHFWYSRNESSNMCLLASPCFCLSVTAQLGQASRDTLKGFFMNVDGTLVNVTTRTIMNASPKSVLQTSRTQA